MRETSVVLCCRSNAAPPWRTHPEHPRLQGAPTCSLPCFRPSLPTTSPRTPSSRSAASGDGAADRSTDDGATDAQRPWRRRTTVDVVTKVPAASSRSPWLPAYLATVVVGSLVIGAILWFTASRPDPGPLILLCLMGILSFQIREPDVGLRVSFSFLSIILVSSATIVGTLGAWVVASVSMLIDRRQPRWTATMFNAA